jgi:hypothetical protein
MRGMPSVRIHVDGGFAAGASSMFGASSATKFLSENNKKFFGSQFTFYLTT